jgi:D-alanyl-D-alanine carboxypeptidase/D-alanyl-D-alanine-endopeptidase (penicillin-binding protein 4)
MGVDTSKGIYIKDGSGLSRQNLVSSDFFCRFLEAMMHSPAFEAYVESLPSPGDNGTLKFNMKSYPEELRSRIKVKSGSMNGIRCYSGYIIPTEGTKEETIIFSIMTSNCTSPTWKVRPMLDKLMATLAEIN